MAGLTLPARQTGLSRGPVSQRSNRSRRGGPTAAAVAEPPTRLAVPRQQQQQSDSGSAMDGGATYNGGMFCIWPRFMAAATPSAFSQVAQAQAPQQRSQRQLSPELAALAGVFTDAPVTEQAEDWAGVWRYQGLRL